MQKTAQARQDKVVDIEQGQHMKDVIIASLAPHGMIRAAINMSNFLLVSGRTESGQPDGLSPDVAHELARRLGVFCELIPFEGPGLLADAAGCDIWDIGNIAVEPERAEVIDFSQPYIQIDANFMTREGSILANNADVNQQAVEVVLYKRSAYDLWLKENYTAPTYRRLESISESVTAFEEGQGDVLACLKPKLMAMRSVQPNYRIIDPPFTAIRQAIGLNKGHAEALGFVNETIADLLTNGFVDDSLKRHGVRDKLSLPS